MRWAKLGAQTRRMWEFSGRAGRARSFASAGGNRSGTFRFPGGIGSPIFRPKCYTWPLRLRHRDCAIATAIHFPLLPQAVFDMFPERLSPQDLYRFLTAPYRRYRLRRQMRAGTVPITVLYYHRVSDSLSTPWTISRDRFRQHLDWLRKHFEMLSMDQVHQRLTAGYNDRAAVAITFDDGYADNMDFALPFLAEHRIPCMYYVSTVHVMNQTPFPHDLDLSVVVPPNSVDDLKQIRSWGIDIGSHTRTHPDLGRIVDPVILREEIADSRRELLALLDTPIDHFAFPFGQTGNITAAALAVAREAGYKTACGAYGGYNFVGQDPFLIQRWHGDPHLARVKNWTTIDPRRVGIRPPAGWLAGATAAGPATSPTVASGQLPLSPRVSSASSTLTCPSPLPRSHSEAAGGTGIAHAAAP